MADEIPDNEAPLPVTKPLVGRQSARSIPAPGRTASSPGRTSPGRTSTGKSVANEKGIPSAKASTTKASTTKASTIKPVGKADGLPPGWADEEALAVPKKSFGPVGMVAAALLLMVIVYLGATVLMRQQ